MVSVSLIGLLAPQNTKAAGDQRSPASLMASPQSLAMVAVKIFVKLNMIAPMRIVGVRMTLTQTRTKPVFVARKNSGQPPGQFMRHLPQVHPVTRARGKFDGETIPVKMMVTL